MALRSMPLPPVLARSLVAAFVLAAVPLCARAEAPPGPPEAVTDGGAPSLSRVLALARDRAPAVAAAREDVAVGRAEHVGARLAPLGNPYLELTAGRGSAGATRDVALQGSLLLPVEIGGQRGRRIAEADALVTLREAELDTARAGATGDAVRAYGAAAVAGARVRAWEGLVAVARDEAEIYRARLAARDTTEQDEKLARVELARNVVTLAEARADVIRALTELGRLTGARFTAPPDGPAEPPEPTRTTGAARGPAVRALESEAALHGRTRERQAREAVGPLNLIVTAGRGDLGEARFGGGLGWTLPIPRAGQGEQARAEAARARALRLRDVTARAAAFVIEGLVAEGRQVRRALDEVTTAAEPAARAAVEAAVATQRAGKGDLLAVLTARRDLALLEGRRLDLLLRAWTILGDVVALTGELP
jgi:cobalt-zinc-cadmium efflux system outer membrane protein